MASGHVNRVKRPNTWLHRPTLQNVKKVLANPEPHASRPHRPENERREIDVVFDAFDARGWLPESQVYGQWLVRMPTNPL
jgi:hypothetical protein